MLPINFGIRATRSGSLRSRSSGNETREAGAECSVPLLTGGSCWERRSVQRAQLAPADFRQSRHGLGGVVAEDVHRADDLVGLVADRSPSLIATDSELGRARRSSRLHAVQLVRASLEF